jgi:HAD superfamily hydrolase (TIGR01509 family)
MPDDTARAAAPGSTAIDSPPATGELAAVLWDLDGTLIDSEPIWWQVEVELFEKYGGTWTVELAKSLVGRDLRDSARGMLEHFEHCSKTPEELVVEMVAKVEERFRAEVTFQPGVIELLRALADAGVPMALVTASYRVLVDALLTHLTGITFDAIVSGDDVTLGTPHPEPYLTAIARLGVAPADCVAIEDSHAGSESAQAAGAYVLVVPHVVTPEPGAGRTVVDSLAGVDVAFLRGLISPTDAAAH